MDQLRLFFATNSREDPRRFGVDLKRLVTLRLAKIDIGERGAVDQNVEIDCGDFLPHLLEIREIKLRVIETDDIEFVAIFTSERRAEAAAATDNHDFHFLCSGAL